MGNSAEAPKDPEEANFPEKEKIHEPLNFSRELIKRTANLIVDDRSAFLYLINLINLIKSIKIHSGMNIYFTPFIFSTINCCK